MRLYRVPAEASISILNTHIGVSIGEGIARRCTTLYGHAWDVSGIANQGATTRGAAIQGRLDNASHSAESTCLRSDGGDNL